MKLLVDYLGLDSNGRGDFRITQAPYTVPYETLIPVIGKSLAQAERIERLEAALRWIPVSERLPNVNVLVLVANPDWPAGFPSVMHGHIDGLGKWCGHYADVSQCDSLGICSLPTADPTHWMPLPEPPKAEAALAQGRQGTE